MSTTIRKTTITHTRGDTLKVNVNISDSNGATYQPSESDIIKFGMKKDFSDVECIIEKIIPSDTGMLCLLPNDTNDLDFGEYVYDIQIDIDGKGSDIYTFLKGKINITEEVVR